MAEKPTISIIIVNYNGLSYLDTCISSVLAQDYQDYEVILVDNASTDGSVEHVSRNYPNVILVSTDRNTGYAGGINRGLKYARGKYIAPLNNDTEVAPGWLSTMVGFLESRADIGAVTPKILLFDERDRVNAEGLYIHISALGFCRNLKKMDIFSTEPCRVNGVSGCSYLVRREILESTCGIPEECFMANDDVIISWLITMMGYDIYCVPGSVIYHRYRLKMDSQKLLRLEKNRLSLLLYGLKPVTFIVLLPLYLIIELMIIVFCMIKGSEYIKAKFSAYRELHKDCALIKKRREQYGKLRGISDCRLLSKLSWNLQWRQLINISK